MTLKDIQQEVINFNALFSKVDNDKEDFDDQIVIQHTMNLADYLEFLEECAKTPYGKVFSQFREFIVPHVVAFYSNADAEVRQTICNIVTETPFVSIELCSLLDEFEWRLEKTDIYHKTQLIKTILLIAVINEKYLNDLDTARLLTATWNNAESAGLEPQLFFDEAANMAGEKLLLHGMTPKDILLTFEPLLFY